MEPTLSLKKSEFEAEVGLFLGYGRGEEFGDPEWSDQQTAAIESVVRSGLRQFYFPPPMDGVSYDWSFLRPAKDLTLALAATAVDLPDDFGGFEGELTLQASDRVYCSVAITNEGVIDAYYAENADTTGQPRMAAVRPLRGTGSSRGQRFDLYVWPAADQAYTLRFQYYLVPDALTGTRPYAYGGAEHAETILESCLAIAEERLDDARAVHAMKFRERLAASISLDRRKKAQHLGYNGDGSDNPWRVRRRDRRGDVVVTFDGSEYE